MANLIEGLIEQMNRCREVLKQYEQIPEGAIGASFIRQDIANAETAMASGDAVKMLAAYKTLESVE